MAASRRWRLSLLLVALAAAGCDAIDPYARPGVWTPTGASEANLRAMVANPADLARGADEQGTQGQPAADAVAAWRAGHAKPLPAGDTAQPGQPPADSGAGGAPPGMGGAPSGAPSGGGAGVGAGGAGNGAN